MAAINVELIGGPGDGTTMSLTDAELDLFSGLPKDILVRGQSSAEPDANGRYVVTRKLTKRGRLIYEWSTLR
jgi:hypothetical protein